MDPDPDPDPLVRGMDQNVRDPQHCPLQCGVVKMADATLSHPPIKWSDNVFKLSTQCVI